MANPGCTLPHEALVRAGRTQNRHWRGSELRRFVRLRLKLKYSTIWIRLFFSNCCRQNSKIILTRVSCIQTGNCCPPYWTWKVSFKTELEFMTHLAFKISGFSGPYELATPPYPTPPPLPIRKIKSTLLGPFQKFAVSVCGFTGFVSTEGRFVCGFKGIRIRLDGAFKIFN